MHVNYRSEVIEEPAFVCLEIALSCSPVVLQLLTSSSLQYKENLRYVSHNKQRGGFKTGNESRIDYQPTKAIG